MQDHLSEQLGFLDLSSASFDAGHELEAKRLAVVIRTLVHDTEHSVSLLRQLGLKTHMPFVHSGQPEPDVNSPSGTMMVGAGLCSMNMDFDSRTVRYVPFLGDLPSDRIHPPMCFEDWWRWPVFRDMTGNTFDRRKLVLSVANKDGGAHVDAQLPNDYRALAYENSAGFGQSVSSDGFLGISFPFSLNGEPLPPPDKIAGKPLQNSLVLASIRQISWELSTSIKRAIETHADGDHSLRIAICPIPLTQGIRSGRNLPCPCGSGRRAKDCYLAKRFPLKAVAPQAVEMAERTGSGE